MNSWITFWKWAYIFGLGSFFLLAIVILPLGLRDLLVLFRHLAKQREKDRPCRKQTPTT